jgi:hypothetical protein
MRFRSCKSPLAPLFSKRGTDQSRRSKSSFKKIPLFKRGIKGDFSGAKDYETVLPGEKEPISSHGSNDLANITPQWSFKRVILDKRG